MMPKVLPTVQCFRTNFSILTSEKYFKNLIFLSIFASKRTFCGYFLWNVCTYFRITFTWFFTSKGSFGGYFQWKTCTSFQKICRWTRYIHAKFIAVTQLFWSHFSVFALEKQPENLIFQIFFTSKRGFCGCFQ